MVVGRYHCYTENWSNIFSIYLITESNSILLTFSHSSSNSKIQHIE